MLSIKLIGGAMVAVGVIWWGMSEAQKLNARAGLLKAIALGLATTKSQIEFGRYDIGYIFKRLSVANDGGIFRLCAENIPNKGIKEAWQSAVEDVCSNTPLKESDKTIISGLGNTLGMSDVKGQINNIDLVADELRHSILVAEDEYMRLAKVYRGCSLLLGAFIMIILL